MTWISWVPSYTSRYRCCSRGRREQQESRNPRGGEWQEGERGTTNGRQREGDGGGKRKSKDEGEGEGEEGEDEDEDGDAAHAGKEEEEE